MPILIFGQVYLFMRHPLAIFWYFYEKEPKIDLNSSSGPLLGRSIILKVHNTGTEESKNQDYSRYMPVSDSELLILMEYRGRP